MTFTSVKVICADFVQISTRLKRNLLIFSTCGAYGVTGRYSNQLNYRTSIVALFQKRVQKYCFFLT